ncbi:MAG: hypothetical protein K2Y56_16510 [Methylobacterium sp.]|uniref:hypothetical protein n=1 Tax=Methylobacterium sp. TaxID=409 RepID=UPI0025F4CD54|nr:hypothetical protein [Methylobacterium sp.]MBX9933113.1 hypothetical protein [Methylobacterium sp.]
MLNELLCNRILGIDKAVIQVSQGRNAKEAAATIRANLIDLLSLLDRNPGLDAAADDLQKSVHAIVEAGDRGGVEDRQMRLLTEAHARYKDRLEAAGVELIPEKSGGPGVRLRKA